MQNADLISLPELCKMLSISLATGRNWIKLNKITPCQILNKTPYFLRSYVEDLKVNIASSTSSQLKSRRNKKFVSGNFLYKSYVATSSVNLPKLEQLLLLLEQKVVKLDVNAIKLVVADCALHQLASKLDLTFKGETQLLKKYLQGKIKLSCYQELIADLICSQSKALEFCEQNEDLFTFSYQYEAGEDFLGLMYISCQNLGQRKSTGAYYTPTKIVKKLIASLDFTVQGKIIDPCAGTGNFLLQLPASIPFSLVYGNDLDPVSTMITRINMALKYTGVEVWEIYEHITAKDYLIDYNEDNFQYIIGNPPWGYEFTLEQKQELKKLYSVATSNNIESYDVIIEHALDSLTVGGTLAFVLPEAILNVKAHTNIRKIVMRQNSIKLIEYLGDAFDGVQCPSIILNIQHTTRPMSTVGVRIQDAKREFVINTDRPIVADYFNFLTNDAEYNIIRKLKEGVSVTYLKDQADFALGIVTGNNKELLTSVKDSEHEMILKGSDIFKFHFKNSDNFICFEPANFQQVAPTQLYRAPQKLLYRFICNQLVFAYDDKQTLSLNSCNIVIPKIKNLNMKYILAILNSKIAQFIFKMEFNSIKVLRSHIENIPVPIPTASTEFLVVELVDKILQESDSGQIKNLYEKLDELIASIFKLDVIDYQMIKDVVDIDNTFLP